MLNPASLNFRSLLDCCRAEDPNEVGIILHRDGFVCDLSEETAAMFGATRDELIGRRLIDLIVAEAQDQPVGNANAISRDGALVPIEIVGRASARK
jgi:PAS domain S-box-containing protein